MNKQRFVVSDVLWQRLEPHLPGDAGASAKDNRLFLEAVFLRMRTGSPWRRLPLAIGTASFGGFVDGPSPAYSKVFSKP